MPRSGHAWPDRTMRVTDRTTCPDRSMHGDWTQWPRSDKPPSEKRSAARLHLAAPSISRPWPMSRAILRRRQHSTSAREAPPLCTPLPTRLRRHGRRHRRRRGRRPGVQDGGGPARSRTGVFGVARAESDLGGSYDLREKQIHSSRSVCTSISHSSCHLHCTHRLFYV